MQHCKNKTTGRKLTDWLKPSLLTALAVINLESGFEPKACGQSTDSADSAVSLFNEKCSGCHTVGGGNLVGPDLAPVARMSQTDVLQAVKRMEKNVGPLNDDQVVALVKFLRDPDAAKRLKAQEQKTLVSSGSGNIEKGSADYGQRLFHGLQPFANGGTACIACHQVDGIGGTMAPDLTNIAGKMSETALSSACEQVSFKVMKAAYREHPITKKEALDLSAYLFSLRSPHPKSLPAPITLIGGGIALILFAAIAIGYRNRKRSAKSKLTRR